MVTKSKKSRSILKFVILSVIASTFLYSDIASSALLSSPFNQTVGDQLKDSARENLHRVENIHGRRNFSPTLTGRSWGQLKG